MELNLEIVVAIQQFLDDQFTVKMYHLNNLAPFYRMFYMDRTNAADSIDIKEFIREKVLLLVYNPRFLLKLVEKALIIAEFAALYIHRA
jgi:hypothetical protein